MRLLCCFNMRASYSYSPTLDKKSAAVRPLKPHCQVPAGRQKPKNTFFPTPAIRNRAKALVPFLPNTGRPEKSEVFQR